MKNFSNSSLAVLFLLALASPALSQDLSLNVETYQLGFGEYMDYNDVLLTNNSSDTIEVALRLDKTCFSESDETTITICFGELCFAPTNQPSTVWGVQGPIVLLLPPSETSGQIKFTPSPNGELGSEWNLIFFDRNNLSNRATLQVQYDACSPTVNTTDLSNSIRPAYPNPTTDFITIPTNHFSGSGGELNILNSSGLLLKSIPLNQNEVSKELDVSDFGNGIYFYTISNSEGLRSPASAFLKQD